MSRSNSSHRTPMDLSTSANQHDDLVISPAGDSQDGASNPRISPLRQRKVQPTDEACEEQYEESPAGAGSRGERIRSTFIKGGKLQPFRLLREDLWNLRHRWVSDWCLFNQLVLASAVYVFFTNILPGITFASDLYELTGQAWGTIEVVFSTGICGLIFAM